MGSDPEQCTPPPAFLTTSKVSRVSQLPLPKAEATAERTDVGIPSHSAQSCLLRAAIMGNLLVKKHAPCQSHLSTTTTQKVTFQTGCQLPKSSAEKIIVSSRLITPLFNERTKGTEQISPALASVTPLPNSKPVCLESSQKQGFQRLQLLKRRKKNY